MNHPSYDLNLEKKYDAIGTKSTHDAQKSFQKQILLEMISNLPWMIGEGLRDSTDLSTFNFRETKVANNMAGHSICEAMNINTKDHKMQLRVTMGWELLGEDITTKEIAKQRRTL